MEQVRRAIRVRHYSRRTEEAYAGWIRRYIQRHGMTHPASLRVEHVAAFLSALATEGHVSASTQNQALSAVLFLYRVVLGGDLEAIEGFVRAREPRRLPVVLTRGEVSAILARLEGGAWLIVSLLYGADLRLHEVLVWIASIQEPAPRGCGSSCFRPLAFAETRGGVRHADSTCTNQPSSGA